MSIHQYRAELVDVIDGDTYDFDVDLGFHVTKRIRVRLKGIDTAETYGVKKESEEYKQGKEQAEFVKEALQNADEVILRTYKDDKGKYGRYLADVKLSEQGDLGELLVEEFGDSIKYE